MDELVTNDALDILNPWQMMATCLLQDLTSSPAISPRPRAIPLSNPRRPRAEAGIAFLTRNLSNLRSRRTHLCNLVLGVDVEATETPRLGMVLARLVPHPRVACEVDGVVAVLRRKSVQSRERLNAVQRCRWYHEPAPPTFRIHPQYRYSILIDFIVGAELCRRWLGNYCSPNVPDSVKGKAEGGVAVVSGSTAEMFCRTETSASSRK
ncbi:hypothetical protein K438DRAFT_2045369 [Mycena galopus ATCC 62051]|nr:hypothetical protein K438DRAFT_2045369 [Mycena galopus ATCC 62051]